MEFQNIFWAAVMVAVLPAVLTGCKASMPAGKSMSGNMSSLPSIVNIGTQQIPDDERIAIAKGYFQEEMGIKVNVMEFQAGDIRNAMVAKDIDFALLGSSSAALGIASGMNVELIWVHEILGDAEQLVARNGSGIESVKDLKGKKVATPFSSTSHYSLLKAMELNRLEEKDVTLFDMQMPDIYAAWQRGDIDAAYGWEPTLSELLRSGKTILSSSDLASQGITTSNVEIVRTEFAEKYPELVTKYIKALSRAVELYQNNPADAVLSVAQSLNIATEDAQKQMKGSIWLSAKQEVEPACLGTNLQKGHMVDSLKDMADFLYKQKVLVSQPRLATFEQAVNPSYVEKMIQEN